MPFLIYKTGEKKIQKFDKCFLCQPAEEETFITKSVKMINLYRGQSGSSSQKKMKLFSVPRISYLEINPTDIFTNVCDDVITSLYTAATCVDQ